MFFNVWLHSLIMFLRLAHVVANITISFLFPVKSSIIWMYYISFIHSPADGHLSYFHFLATVSIAIPNSQPKNLCANMRLYFSLAEITGSYGYSTMNLWRKCQTIFQSGCAILLLISSV